MRGAVGSLNASVAGSILLYEAATQRAGSALAAGRSSPAAEPEGSPIEREVSAEAATAGADPRSPETDTSEPPEPTPTTSAQRATSRRPAAGRPATADRDGCHR